MSYRIISTLNAIALVAFGAMFLAVPELALKLFGTETYEATIFVARFFGGALAMAGMFVWMTKELQEPRVVRTMTIMLLASSIVGFILSLLGIVWVNVIRANGWVLLVIHIFFVLAYGYLVSGVTVVRKNQQQY